MNIRIAKMSEEQLAALRRWVRAEVAVGLGETEYFAEEAFDALSDTLAEGPETPQGATTVIDGLSQPLQQQATLVRAVEDAIQHMKGRILNRLRDKTGWGRNELETMVRNAAEVAMNDFKRTLPSPVKPGFDESAWDTLVTSADKLPWED